MIPQLPALIPNSLHPLALAAVVHTLEPAVDRGRPPIWRRSGAYDRFLAHMLEQLPRQTIPDGPNAGRTPLERVNLESHDDLIVALVKSWATVADVLSFYQERIANEGFLRTAVEERSVFELARLVGYSPDPGLAAVTWLAFTVAESRGISPDFVVPAGTRAMSIPSQGDRPQPFETTAPLAARAEWNAMAAAAPEALVRQRVDARTREIVLDGTETKLLTGEPLLIVDGELRAPDPPPRWRSVTVRSVEVDPAAVAPALPGLSPRALEVLDRRVARPGRGPARRTTRVVWDPPAGPVTAPAVEEPAVYAFREQARLFGWDADDWGKLPARERERHVDPLGRVATSPDGGFNWVPPSEGLPPQAQVQALAVDQQGRIFAGTDGRGVYRSLDGGKTWETANAGLGRRDVRSLAVDPSGHVFAGLVGGVCRSLDAGASWEPIYGDQRARFSLRRGIGVANTHLPNLAIKAVASYVHRHDKKAYLFAGSDGGVFRSRSAAEGWEQLHEGLPQGGDGGGVVVNAIAVHEDSDYVYLGTDQGVYYSRDAGHHWIAVNDGLPTVETRSGTAPAAVTALLAYTDPFGPDTYILAATEHGLFRAIDPDTSWTQVAASHFGDEQARVGCLAVWFDEKEHATCVLAGTDQGLFRSLDHGDTWRLASDAVAGEVRAVAAGGPTIAAAVPMRWPSGDEWPGFGITGDQIDLDDTYLSIVNGGWLLLRQPREHGAPLEGLYPVLEARRVLRRDFGRRRVVTRVITRPDEQLHAFDPRRTLVYGREQRLALAHAADPSLGGRVITLAGRLGRALEPGRRVIVGGKRVRARVARRQGSLTLRDADGRPLVDLAAGDLPVVTAAPEALPDGTSRWRLRTGGGVEGWATAAAGELVPEVAAEDDPVVHELAEVSSTAIDDGAGRSRLVLAEPLVNLFDGHTVVVRGNVARATHGETIAAEVLGSGDYQQTNQRFPLRRAPLTWAPDPETGEPSCSLTVYVNRVKWRRVDSLYEAGPHDHCYTLETDENGVTYVVFGDGVMGARLPSGFENVVASYRSGLGAEGEVRAEGIAQLMSRPLGLRSVTNPLPAAGAASPESPEEIRRRAPLRARALRRIVSREDYVDFARNYPGVAKVDAQILWDGRRRLTHVTIAAREGARDDEGVRAGLVAAIAGAQAGSQAVVVDACERLDFEVDATLRLEEGRQPDGVEDEERAALVRAFGFERRELGEPVAASDVVALLQHIPGVAGVDLERLALPGAPWGPPPAFLRARKARWDREAQRVRPAQILVVAAQACRLTVVEGP